MQDELFMKMKEPLKKKCLFSVLASGMGFLGMIFIIFLPIMSGKTSMGTYSYSVVQDIQAIFGGVNEGIGLNIIMALPYFYILFGVVMSIVDMIKGVSRIVGIDDYLMETYDNIKNGVDEKPKNRRGFYGENASVGLIVSGGVALIVYKYLFAFMIEVGYAFTGFSKWIILPALILIASVVINYVGNYYKKKVKKEILKEKYETPFQ